MPKSIYEQLEEACLPLITSYQDDLVKHDKATLAEWPAAHFLHFTRPTGTDLELLYPFNNSTWPAPSAIGSYLLGQATSEHILTSSTIDVVANEKARSNVTCHYFDGVTLKKITIGEAMEIAKSYVERVEEEWRKAEL